MAVAPAASFSTPGRLAPSPLLDATKRESSSERLLALRGGGAVSPDAYCMALAGVYGGFGLFLTIAPETCFGGSSPVSYWTEFGEAGVWFARALGITMLSLYTSPMWAGMPTDVLTKVALPIGIVSFGLFYQAAAILPTASGAKNAFLPFNLWWTQVVLQAGLVVANVLALM